MWAKGTHRFFVVLYQLFSKLEIISKENKIVKVILPLMNHTHSQSFLCPLAAVYYSYSRSLWISCTVYWFEFKLKLLFLHSWQGCWRLQQGQWSPLLLRQFWFSPHGVRCPVAQWLRKECYAFRRINLYHHALPFFIPDNVLWFEVSSVWN